MWYFTLQISCSFILHMDASNYAVGAALTQEMEGIECPVTYASRKLNPQEQRCATIERECLGIKWGVEYFRYYLLGHKFTLITEHAPLKQLKTTRMDNTQITRWVLALQPFQFDILGLDTPM